MSHQSDLIATDIEAYLKQHENKELLRFLTCGSVDDGKSTLIGRLLHDSKMIYEDQLAAVQSESSRIGNAGEKLDLALLVDETVSFESIREVAVSQGGEFLKSVTLFDVYQGKGVEPGQKSLALGLTWQHPSRTLNDEEINEVIDFVVSALKNEFGATLRV